jgi:hypothetical protein
MADLPTQPPVRHSNAESPLCWSLEGHSAATDAFTDIILASGLKGPFSADDGGADRPGGRSRGPLKILRLNFSPFPEVSENAGRSFHILPARRAGLVSGQIFKLPTFWALNKIFKLSSSYIADQ